MGQRSIQRQLGRESVVQWCIRYGGQSLQHVAALGPGDENHTLVTVFSPTETTSCSFSPTFRDVHLMTWGSCRIILFRDRNVLGEASNCIVQ